MTYLDELLVLRRAAVARKKTAKPLAAFRDEALRRDDVRDFAAALRSGTPSIVAEFKRSSPSAGSINLRADPAAVAAAYERGGAAAVSVLTEPDRFGGSHEDLRAARAAVSVPVLCKDFIVDAYQVWEAVADGADAVLLIVAALDDVQLRGLLSLATALGIAALVEVHDEAEAARAVSAGARIIGINNRDLRTFGVDIATATRVRGVIAQGIVIVAESGYKTPGEIAACARAGIHAVLIGESLMREDDPAEAISRLRGAVL